MVYSFHHDTCYIAAVTLWRHCTMAGNSSSLGRKVRSQYCGTDLRLPQQERDIRFREICTVCVVFLGENRAVPYISVFRIFLLQIPLNWTQIGKSRRATNNFFSDTTHSIGADIGTGNVCRPDSEDGLLWNDAVSFGTL